MSIRKWDLLTFVFIAEVNSFDVAEEFGVTLEVARMWLLRAFNQGWLDRRKFEGIYYYKVSKKGWRFYDEFGSFTNHPFYG